MDVVFEDHDLLNPRKVPSCFIFNLQVVNFEGLNGKEHELCFAKFAMDHA